MTTLLNSIWRFGSGPKHAAIQPIDIGGDQPIIDQGDIGGGSTPINVDAGDVSGGSTSDAAAAAQQQIEEFASEGGGLLAMVYGEHLIAGHLIVHKFTPGTPNTSIVMVALGDGRGNGGDTGEWEGAVAVYYAGGAQSVSPNGSTAGYRFYNGYISTDVSTGLQPVDAFLTGGLAYSGTAYIACKLSDAVANAEDRPDKLRGRYKGRRSLDFDAIGKITSYGYSTNPARVAADCIRTYYTHKTPTDSNLALRKLEEKIDWEAWKIWANINDQQISWDNGTSVINIPRFECHIAFTEPTILADALDQICAASGAQWQDDGEKIKFIPPTGGIGDVTGPFPSHHFDESNIVRAPQIEPRDLRERPNYFVLEYRDFDDQYLGLSSVEVRRDSLIKQVGEIKSTRALPNMRQSQAQRLLERQARLEADNPNICTLAGDETSIHVLPGDIVTISHIIPGWTYQKCIVLSVSLSTAEEGPDVCEFVLQAFDELPYSDTAHGPRQGALTP